MAVPATTGRLRTSLHEMEIGDYIIVHFDKSTDTTDFGTVGFSEIPITGISGNSQSGWWYMIKVDKGLLVSDRVTSHSVSWDTLNRVWKCIEGNTRTMGGVEGVYRSLTGGVAYADAYGNVRLTVQGYGAFPTNNEWDKYITNFPPELIREGSTLNDVFHWVGVKTWCQETPVNNLVSAAGTLGTSNYRVNRGRDDVDFLGFNLASFSSTDIGFRPVFEYRESR